jgi:hypothetical protein
LIIYQLKIGAMSFDPPGDACQQTLHVASIIADDRTSDDSRSVIVVVLDLCR